MTSEEKFVERVRALVAASEMAGGLADPKSPLLIALRAELEKLDGITGLRTFTWTLSQQPNVVRGARNGNAKLTESIIAEAKGLHASGETYVALGLRYGLSESAIRRAVSGRSWAKHSPRPANWSEEP